LNRISLISLAGRITHLITPTLPMRREEENYTLGVFMTLADGLQSILSQHGMDLVMYASERWDDECARVRRLVERR
jgi:DNA-binding LacI/PurR family transcriptional regulator